MIATDQLVGRVATDADETRVDIDDATVAIGDREDRMFVECAAQRRDLAQCGFRTQARVVQFGLRKSRL